MSKNRLEQASHGESARDSAEANAKRQSAPTDDGGVAFSCIVAAVAGFILTSPLFDYRGAIFAFLCYVVIAGILVQRRGADAFGTIIWRSLPSSVFLAMSGAAINGVVWLVRGMQGEAKVGVGGQSMGIQFTFPEQWAAFVMLIVVGCVLSLVFTTVASYAAGKVINIALQVWALGPRKASSINQLIKRWTEILVTCSALLVLIYNYIK